MSNRECEEKYQPIEGGGIANYLLNLDELEDVVEEQIKDKLTPHTKTGIQRSKGFYIISNDFGVEDEVWEVPSDIQLTGMTFVQEEVRNMGYEDYINVYINDELYFETVFLKEMQEKKWFRQMVEVKKGDVIKIEYINDTGIEKEFKIDLEYIGETPQVDEPINPPIVDPEESTEPPVELLPIYRAYMRYEGNTSADLDMYVNMFDESDLSDISPSKTVGFSRRQWGSDAFNMVTMPQSSDNHLGANDREEKPEVIEIYGKPSNYFRFYVVNYKDGYKLTENVTLDIYKVNENGLDGELLGHFEKEGSLFHTENTREYIFIFDINTEHLEELW